MPDIRTGMIFVYPILILGYSISTGLFTYPSFIVTLFSFLALIFFWLKGVPKILDPKNMDNFLKTILLLSIATSLMLPNSLYQLDTTLKDVQYFLYAFSFLIASFLFFKIKSTFTTNLIYLFLLFVAISTEVLVVVNTPFPLIDVFDILQRGSEYLLQGKNPYVETYTPLYSGVAPDYFTYMPFAFILTAPFRVLLGDIRFIYIFSHLVTIWVIFNVSKKNGASQNRALLLSLIFLYHPLSMYIVEEAWLEPLIIALFALFGYFYSLKKTLHALLFLSLTLGIKQNMFLAIPFVLKLKGVTLLKVAKAYMPVVLLIIFFASLSLQDFINDTIVEPYLRKTRFDALTIYSFLNWLHNDIKVPRMLYLTPIVFMYIFLRKKWSDIQTFYVGFAIWFLSSLLFFREAFLNQYYFVSSLMLISMAFEKQKSRNNV